jgi:hypothetical protein
MAIKASVLDRLRDVRGADRRFPGQICYGPGDLQDPAVGAGGESQPVDGHFDEPARLLVERTDGPDLTVGHAGVEQGFVSGKTVFLDLPGLFDADPDVGGGVARFPGRQIAVADRGDLDMDVDPIQQWSGDPALILADLLGRAAAGTAPVAEITAGASIRDTFLKKFHQSFRLHCRIIG